MKKTDGSVAPTPTVEPIEAKELEQVVEKVEAPKKEEKKEEPKSTNKTESKPASKPEGNKENPKPAKQENKPAVKPAHEHTWKPITKVIHHEAIGHNETINHPEKSHMEKVLVKAAWTEQKPDHNIITCSCGKQFRTTDEWEKHAKASVKAGKDTCYSYSVETIYKDVKHPAEYKEVKKVDQAAWTEKKWVVDKPAWDETVTIGQQCTGCGAKK